jgi:hypothetical protein
MFRIANNFAESEPGHFGLSQNPGAAPKAGSDPAEFQGPDGNNKGCFKKDAVKDSCLGGVGSFSDF